MADTYLEADYYDYQNYQYHYYPDPSQDLYKDDYQNYFSGNTAAQFQTVMASNSHHHELPIRNEFFPAFPGAVAHMSKNRLHPPRGPSPTTESSVMLEEPFKGPSPSPPLDPRDKIWNPPEDASCIVIAKRCEEQSYYKLTYKHIYMEN